MSLVRLNMKTLQITVVTFLLLIQIKRQMAELQDSDRHKIALECISQVGIRREIVEQAIAGNIPKNNLKYKKFLACSYKKQGYQNENGDILIENIKTFLQKFYNSSDLKVLDNCAGYTGLNHGETAYNAMQCIMYQIRNVTSITKD